MENRSRIKAETFAEILRSAPITITPGRIFQQGLQAEPILTQQRRQWWAQEVAAFREINDTMNLARQVGAYRLVPDFGHTSSNTKALIQHGFSGIPQLVKPGTELRESANICFEAMANYCLRLADQDGVSKENAAALRHLAVGAPRNTYEAMQLLSLYFYLHEFVGGTRLRTLGRLDEILFPFYQADKEQGMTYEQSKALWMEFLTELWLMKVPYDLPFCIGGLGEDGNEITNELSYLIVDAYDACHIYSPKIHVRTSNKTPDDFLKRVLACIRGGNSSFVFINDEVGIPMMLNCGATLEDARNFVPIGCYEPAIYAKELGCTDNGKINTVKAVEFAFNNGRDYRTNQLFGLETGEIDSYKSFYNAVKAQLAYMINQSFLYIREAERHYFAANPDPILSALISPCAENGVDAYAGGAKYNNSSLSVGSLGSLADAVYATKYLVFDQKRLTFAQLGEILRSNWEGHEDLRNEMLHLPEKYGNNVEKVDAIAADLAAYCASLINGQPNARGGIFKASSFTLDWCFEYGKKTMATPDGRKHGDPLSKNHSAVIGMDRKGVTSLIQSATKLNPSQFPNGSVLDFVLHPSAVAGEDGLDAFLALLKVYFTKGGFAMHGNVFRAEDLRAAQTEPEKYANLQVRVCGWNVFFVNLSKEEQDAFIKQAEGAV